MAKRDWEKLAGEKGERVSSSRVGRALKIGKMGAGVAASSLAGKMKSLLAGDDAEAVLKDAYEKNAEHMVQVLGQLKGASMKIGQMLSADPEALPPEFSEGLAALQQSAPPMTWTAVSEQLERALDRPIDVVFRRFDPEPIGAASIGQVHRAQLHTGEEVAVKVQYPGVAESIDSDLETLRQMLVWGRPFVQKDQLASYFDEIRASLQAEADYEAEAQNILRFSEIFRDRPEFFVPRPFPEWTRTTVLVMEFAEGEKLDDALDRLSQEDKQVILERWLDMYIWLFHEVHEIHADPHPGNFLLDDSGRIVLLDFGSVRRFEPEFTDGLLELLDTVWEDDPERALQIYARLGFGGESFDAGSVEPDLVRQYHEIVLAPFVEDVPFRFHGWQPALDGKKFMLSNPSFFALTPPSDALLYFRLLSGIKGLLGRYDVALNIFGRSVETARARGVRTI